MDCRGHGSGGPDPRRDGRARAELPVGTITEVVLKGNVSLPPEKVLGKVHSRAGRAVNDKLAEEDRQRLLSSKWFSRVKMAW